MNQYIEKAIGMADPDYMTAQEVAEALGINVATVYAYVSRGLIRSEPTGGSKRTRRYDREDVRRLKDRQEQRHNPDKVVEGALHWGTPLLDSSLTLIADGRLYYRGHDVLDLAQQVSIEQIAGLLWREDLQSPITNEGAFYAQRCEVMRDHLDGLTPFEQFQVLLQLAALDDVAAYDLRPESVIQSGARILYFLTAVAAHRTDAHDSIAQTLQRAWMPENEAAAKIINMALVLCADHEFNVSAFTARCIASAGSTPYAAVGGGLAALQGSKHGGSTERVAAFLSEIGTIERVRNVIANRIKRGDSIPGFHHRLYPHGDPRCRVLLDALRNAYPGRLEFADAVIETTGQLLTIHPNVDFALVAMADVMGLPSGTPLALFALGRTVGWIGHALEQYATDQLIRPRARYAGLSPI